MGFNTFHFFLPFTFLLFYFLLLPSYVKENILEKRHAPDR